MRSASIPSRDSTMMSERARTHFQASASHSRKVVLPQRRRRFTGLRCANSNHQTGSTQLTDDAQAPASRGQSRGASNGPSAPPSELLAPAHDRPATHSISSTSTTNSMTSSTSVSSGEDATFLPALLEAEGDHDSGLPGWLAAAALAAGAVLLLGGGYVFRDQISGFIDFFIDAVHEWGPWGYVAFALVYAGLEVLAVPAVPLTLTAGAIFGIVPGTIVVSIAATGAATIAFLIARYAVRDKVAKFARRNPNWVAIDRAIGRDGFKFVTLLRLSPLLPLSLSNYLYGLTSVDLGSYVLGSWVGMLPGTYAYISAGHVGKAVLSAGEGSFDIDPWKIAAGLGISIITFGFVGQLAKNAIDEVNEEQKVADAAAGKVPGGAVQEERDKRTKHRG